MAHSSTKIYKMYSTSPKQGVSIYDLQYMFNSSTRNKIGDIVTYAADHDLINVWAKYKAERINKLGILNLADRQENMFSLDVPVCTNPSTLSTFVAACPGYGYLVPRGKAQQVANDEWFRFDDFAGSVDYQGYNKNANCFVNSNDTVTPSYYIVGQGNTGAFFRIGFNAGNNLHEDSIGIGDMMLGGSEGIAFSELYFGVLLKLTSTYLLCTSNNKLSTDVSTYGGGELTIQEVNGALQNLQTGYTYTVYPVLSEFKHTSPVSMDSLDSIVALPLIEPFSFSIQRVSSVQSLSILPSPAPTAYFDFRARFYATFTLAMTASGSASPSMTAHYEIYPADYNEDTSYTTAITSGNISISTTSPGSVSVGPISGLTYTPYVRLHAYNQNAQTVVTNPDVWVQVTQEELE